MNVSIEGTPGKFLTAAWWPLQKWVHVSSAWTSGPLIRVKLNVLPQIIAHLFHILFIFSI